MRSERGFALVPVLFLCLFMLMIGMALVSSVDTQQTQSRGERERESSFNLAEAALNTQALQLSRTWPSTSGTAYPASCDPTSTSNSCPQPSAVSGAYTSADYGSSCASSPTTPIWQTQVRDNTAGNNLWTTAANNYAQWDANGDNAIWVRSTAVVRCRTTSVVALVARSTSPIAFPNSVVSANWLTTTNQGRKVIIDTLGTSATSPGGPAAQPAAVSLRCNAAPSPCANYQSSKGQIQPPTVQTNSTASTSTVSAAALTQLEQQAQNAGTYWTTCPPANTNLSSVNGAPVVINTATTCAVSFTSNMTINSAANPGALIIERGTLSLGGTTKFYGLIYMVNKQGDTGAVVTVTGNAQIQGAVAVDGAGGVSLGSSKTNLIYDSRAPGLLKGDSGAVVNKNSFRQLPSNTP